MQIVNLVSSKSKTLDFLMAGVILSASCTLASPSLSEVLKHTRLGIGYSYVPGTKILSDRLDLNDPNGEDIKPWPELPAECFAYPGLTKIGVVEDVRLEYLDFIFEVHSHGKHKSIDVVCGEQISNVRIFLEASTNGEDWLIFNNPAPSAMVSVLKDHLDERFRDLTLRVREMNDRAGIWIDGSDGNPLMMMWVQNGYYFAGVPSELPHHQDILLRVLEAGGRSFQKANNSADFGFPNLTAVALSEASFQDVSTTVNFSITEAFKLLSLKNDIPVEGASGFVGSIWFMEYGEHWPERVYAEYLGSGFITSR